MDAAGLKSRSRVRPFFVAVQAIEVVRSRRDVFDFSLEISLSGGEQWSDSLLRFDGPELDDRSVGSPDAKKTAMRF
jgi:hypothetical protein